MSDRSIIKTTIESAEILALRELHPAVRPEGHGITAAEYARIEKIAPNTARKRLEGDDRFECEEMVYGKGISRVYTLKE